MASTNNSDAFCQTQSQELSLYNRKYNDHSWSSVNRERSLKGGVLQQTPKVVIYQNKDNKSACMYQV